MPTYDYECGTCGEKFEKFQSITAPAIRKCPSCGKLAVRRLIGTGAGVIFKGSGFYQTDYRSESYRKAAASDKAPAGDKSAGNGKASSEASPDKASSEAPSSKPSGAAGAADKADKAEKSEKSEKVEPKGKSK
jgi:putative FmdB family regulatory protein